MLMFGFYFWDFDLYNVGGVWVLGFFNVFFLGGDDNGWLRLRVFEIVRRRGFVIKITIFSF